MFRLVRYRYKFDVSESYITYSLVKASAEPHVKCTYCQVLVESRAVPMQPLNWFVLLKELNAFFCYWLKQEVQWLPIEPRSMDFMFHSWMIQALCSVYILSLAFLVCWLYHLCWQKAKDVKLQSISYSFLSQNQKRLLGKNQRFSIWLGIWQFFLNAAIVCYWIYVFKMTARCSLCQIVKKQFQPQLSCSVCISQYGHWA